MRPPLPPPIGAAKASPAGDWQTIAVPKTTGSAAFIYKAKKSVQGILSQLVDQFPNSPGNKSSAPDLKLGAKAHS